MSTHGGYSFPGLNTLFGRVHRVSRSLVPSFLQFVPSFRWFRSFVPSLLSFVPYSQIHHSIKSVNCYPGVVNLSDKILSNAELSLLSKGLTFVDTPDSPDMGVISEDLHKFHLGIKRFSALGKFKTPTTNYDPPPTQIEWTSPEPPFGHPKFRNPSKWNPPGPMIVEHMSLLNQEQLVDKHFPRKTLRFNLTKDERSAKRTLSQNRDIVIKKADKGSAVVIQNGFDYIKEGLRQLTDRNFYRLQEDNLTHVHNKLITEQVKNMVNSKEISTKTAEYLILETPRTPNFYLLPKIHKNKIPPPGQPIVSANRCPSERISQFVDHFIQPLVQKLPPIRGGRERRSV